ncbi:hypothetical protein H8B13_02910 [Hymenobacter sp. BT188]|uniref:hypothetical protein n=1 Tax=Hymenobacter sp. BT188 TaxID=2763504 RepID=UPI0016510196|nr:hypothetical protein [Hymenobacter sp. BT188]MBC6605759.1 hypothetical protein [Hymenobacter sp. BT188]
MAPDRPPIGNAQGNGYYTLQGSSDNPSAWSVILGYETRYPRTGDEQKINPYQIPRNAAFGAGLSLAALDLRASRHQDWQKLVGFCFSGRQQRLRGSGANQHQLLRTKPTVLFALVDDSLIRL